MKAIFIILNQTEYLEDVLNVLIDNGVKGATILDSQGMASAIVHGDIHDIPLFGSLKSVLEGSRPYNKTIFSVIKKDEVVERVIEEVEQLLEDVKKPGVGFIFTVPVDNIVPIGYKKTK